MSSIKRDDNKQSWEDTDFPLVCETCLGDNPYVRMTKEPHGKKCQICDTPFTVFAWQAGTKGRLKRVEICRSCARAKNVCQVCIYDLQYGLPVKARDRVLREAGSAGGAIPGADIPQSIANRAWYTAQQERTLEQGGTLVATANELAHAQLVGMARMEPRYERNLPKLCSFYARGECDRGADCPFRHEMPRDRNDPLAKQNTRDRFYGTSDPVANRILGRKRRQDEIEHKREEQEGYDKARATLYLRLQGDGPFPDLTEVAIRDQFYSFGEIVSVRCNREQGQAFVEYTQPEATELAIATMNRQELLGRRIHVSWARAPKRGDSAAPTAAYASNGPSVRPTVALRPWGPPSTSEQSSSNKKTILPENLKSAVKLPPEVAAAVAARKRQTPMSKRSTNTSSASPVSAGPSGTDPAA